MVAEDASPTRGLFASPRAKRLIIFASPWLPLLLLLVFREAAPVVYLRHVVLYMVLAAVASTALAFRTFKKSFPARAPRAVSLALVILLLVGYSFIAPSSREIDEVLRSVPVPEGGREVFHKATGPAAPFGIGCFWSCQWANVEYEYVSFENRSASLEELIPTLKARGWTGPMEVQDHPRSNSSSLHIRRGGFDGWIRIESGSAGTLDKLSIYLEFRP